MYECKICHKILKMPGCHSETHKPGGRIPWNKNGGIYSSESRAKMSHSQKIRFERDGATNKGIPHTEETKKKMSLANTGKTHIVTLEVRRRISKANKGRPAPENVRKIFADCNRERHKDPEFIKKLRLSQRRKPTSIERIFSDMCKEYNLPFKYVGNGEIWIARKNPDFININGKKQVVEILGSYWHTKEEIEERTKHYAKYGFECINIWDYELKNIELVLSRVNGVVYV